MDKIIPTTNSSTVLSNNISQETDIGMLFTATIQIEHDVSKTFYLSIKQLTNFTNSILILASVEDGNVNCPCKGLSSIRFNNKTYTNFTFMDGELYNRDGRIGKRHVMVQINLEGETYYEDVDGRPKAHVQETSVRRIGGTTQVHAQLGEKT